MQMSGSVVDVFPFPDADQVRDLTGVIEASVPAKKAAAAESGAVEREDLGLRQGLEPLVDIVPDPGHGEALVRPLAVEFRAEGLAHHRERKSSAEGAACECHPRDERTCSRTGEARGAG